MLDENELLFDVLYERTKDFGRTQFIREIMRLERENKELKEKINTYENPDDLTLMFMYCEEKAKDKIKELQNKIHILEDELEWYKQECDDLEMRIGLDE